MTPLRARLFNPPNAVPDTGINMRNGVVVLRAVEYRPSTWRTPQITLLYEIPPLPPPPQPPPPEPDPELPPGRLRPKAMIREIMAQCCLAWSVELYDLISVRRTMDLTIPRHAAVAISCRLTPLSLPHIGRLFGGRDHTTMINSKRKMALHIAALNQELDDWSTPAEWVRALKARLEA